MYTEKGMPVNVPMFWKWFSLGGGIVGDFSCFLYIFYIFQIFSFESVL